VRGEEGGGGWEKISESRGGLGFQSRELIG